MLEMDLSPDLQAQLRRRRGNSGRQPDSDWAELIEVVTELAHALEAERAAGTTATDTRMLELAQRWRALIEQVTSGEQRLPSALANI